MSMIIDRPPFELGAREAAQAIREGSLTSLALVESFLERISERDDAVRAWAFLDPELARERARAADASAPTGALHGVPVALKDIIDACDMPTGFNSPIYPNYRPVADSAVAAMIRASGGIVFGKAETTEFANRHPSSCRNPIDPDRTPGGSSQGSAAAVADGQVPLSIGTQTSGSIVRPAAFCGIVGYKPSFGEISRVGVKQQSGTLDTIGLCARTVADAELLRSVLVGVPDEGASPASGQLTVGFCRSPQWDLADDSARSRLEEVAASMERAGMRLIDLDLPDELFSGWLEDHRRIANFESARNFAYEKHRHRDGLSRALLEGRIIDGERVPVADYIASQRRAEAMRIWYEERMSSMDVVLTLSAGGEAPIGLADTGSAVFNSLWTLLYAPCMTLPAGRGPSGMPLGIQLVGRRFEDEALFSVALAVEPLLADR